MRARALAAAGLVLALVPHAAAAQAAAPVRLANQVALVPVLAHAVQRGDRLSALDFTEQQLPAYRARDALLPAAAEGMEVVRSLPAGATLRAGDVVMPRLVRRGEPVSIRYVAGALTIMTSGRALADGGQGDLVRVVTETSRTIDAVVEGQGAVRLTN